MIILASKVLAQDVWFDEDNIWVSLADGRQISVPLAYFPKLLNAPKAELMDYVISGGGVGIHWDNLDEDISAEGLLLGFGDRTDANIRA
ncbi:MAG: DUF2442 domain-containing protein [Bacillota bacterium]